MGFAQCTICAEDYFRPTAHSSAALCSTCDVIPGVNCSTNTTVATLALVAGYWRHSTATTKTHRCKLDGSWSPCRGGAEAGFEGDGYCAADYRGPRCELCDEPGHTRYFDKLDARCHDCGDVTARTAALSAALLFLLLAYFAANSANYRIKESPTCNVLLNGLRGATAVWREAGMRFKIKTMVGFYQCLSAVPSVFNVVAPVGMEEYTRWIYLLELPSDLESIVVPSTCLGEYHTRLWLGSTWPIALVLVFAAGFILWELLLRCSHKADFRGACVALSAGLQRVLPLTLGLTFLVVPSVSTRIFRTFRCERVEYGEGEVRRYLQADLRLSCDTEEYEDARALAFLCMAVWPVGIPLLYAVLLFASRAALVTGVPTPLSQATAFLSGDFSSHTYWWEPLEMCRKLTLTGESSHQPQPTRLLDLCRTATFLIRLDGMRQDGFFSLGTKPRKPVCSWRSS